jgi:geranylgeranyl pyrophosphate synthase
MQPGAEQERASSAADPLGPAVAAVTACLREAARSCEWPELERRLHERLIDPGLPPTALLPLASCAAGGGAPERAAPFSAACLLVMTCTRWLDDLSDRDCAGALWQDAGEARTITLSAGALTLAWRTLLAADPGPALIARFAQATLRTGAGQDLDLSLETPSVEEGWSILRGKTGAGLALLCAGGAVVAHADPLPYHAFGEHVGVMLQLLDDLDSVVTPRGIGDLVGRKGCNMVLVHGMHAAHGAEVRRLWSLHNSSDLRSLLISSGSVHAVLAAALQERDLALASLAVAKIESGALAELGRDTLVGFARGVFDDLPVDTDNAGSGSGTINKPGDDFTSITDGSFDDNGSTTLSNG